MRQLLPLPASFAGSILPTGQFLPGKFGKSGDRFRRDS